MSQPGYVYLVHGVGTTWIKVGKTTNLLNRLRDLQNGVPFPLEVLSVQLMHDMDAGEEALKAHYQAFHCRGEWFRLPPDILAQWRVNSSIATLSDDRPDDAVLALPAALLDEKRQILALLAQRESLTLQSIYEAFEATSRKDKTRLKVIVHRLKRAGILSQPTRGVYSAEGLGQSLLPLTNPEATRVL